MYVAENKFYFKNMELFSNLVICLLIIILFSLDLYLLPQYGHEKTRIVIECEFRRGSNSAQNAHNINDVCGVSRTLQTNA